MISYAQNFEDVILSRVFTGETGFYIDVGAAHPYYHSVTKWFYDAGWAGINIEPVPMFYDMFADQRPRDVNLKVAVSDHCGTATFYEVQGANTGSSTLCRDTADELSADGTGVRAYDVEVTTLAAVCERHASGPIDFLKVDVEGHERGVLVGMDFDRWRPRVLVIEATKPGQPVPCHDKWEDVLTANRYEFAAFDGLNRYYVREEDREWIPRLAVPVSPFDDYELRDVVDLRAEVAKLRAILANVESVLGDHQVALADHQVALADHRAVIVNLEAVLADHQVALADHQTALVTAHKQLHSRETTLQLCRAHLEELREAVLIQGSSGKRSWPPGRRTAA